MPKVAQSQCSNGRAGNCQIDKLAPSDTTAVGTQIFEPLNCTTRPKRKSAFLRGVLHSWDATRMHS
jgi:hypothetical protein